IRVFGRFKSFRFMNSDSVSLGSNPSSPAKKSPYSATDLNKTDAIKAFFPCSHFWTNATCAPHISRHSAFAVVLRGQDMIETEKLELDAYRQRAGYVYGLGCGRRLLKVGRAINLDARIKSLLTGNPFPLTMRYCIKAWHGFLPDIERWLHKRLRKQHVRHEWFIGKDETF